MALYGTNRLLSIPVIAGAHGIGMPWHMQNDNGNYIPNIENDNTNYISNHSKIYTYLVHISKKAFHSALRHSWLDIYDPFC